MMTALRCALLAALTFTPIVLVAGCATDQAKDVKTYRDVVTVPGDQKGFAPGKPLSLQDAMLLANRNNERLSIAGESYLQSLIEKKRTVSRFLPTVGLSTPYTWSSSRRLPPGAQSHQFDVTAAGAVNVFNGFQDWNTLKVDDLTAQQRKSLLLEAQESLLIDVAAVYYVILRAEQSVEVLQNSLSVQDARVKDMKARREAGMARPLDVFQTEAQASATRVQLIDSQNQAATGRALLAYLVSAPVQNSPLSDGYDLPDAVGQLADYQKVAAQNRKDLQAAQAQAQAARQAVEIALGQYLPSVSVGFNDLLTQHPTVLPPWNGMIGLNMPLFTGGRIEADVEFAWSAYRQAALALEQLTRQVNQDVEINYENFSASTARLVELRVQVKAGDQAFNQADQSYNVGLATNLERIVAQDQMLSAQLAMASQDYDHKIAYLSLLRSMGVIRAQVLTEPATTQPASQPAQLTVISKQ